MSKITTPTLFADSLQKYKITLEKRRKYVKNDFQAFGLELADTLDDREHKSLYIRLAKTHPKELLEKALYFVKDQTQSKINSKGRLFMWKLKQLKNTGV
jgi:hypothetical protein